MEKDTKIVIGAIVILLVTIFIFDAGLTGAWGWSRFSNYFSSYRAPTTYTCTDTDKINEFTKGVVKYAGRSYTDYCAEKGSKVGGFGSKLGYKQVSSCSGDNCYVNEYICSNNKVSSQKIKCNECNAGKCIKESAKDYFTLDIKSSTGTKTSTTPISYNVPRIKFFSGKATLSTDNYVDLVVEYKGYEDLAKSGYSGMGAAEKTIMIHTPIKGMFSLASDPSAEINRIWLTKEGSDVLVFYRDINKVPSVKYFGKVDPSAELIKIKNGDSIFVYPGYEQLKINYKLNVNDYINSYFGVYNEEITSLGGIRALEEADELRLFKEGKYLLLGDHSGDYDTNAGVIIKDPKSNGASDQVLLEVLF